MIINNSSKLDFINMVDPERLDMIMKFMKSIDELKSVHKDRKAIMIADIYDHLMLLFRPTAVVITDKDKK